MDQLELPCLSFFVSWQVVTNLLFIFPGLDFSEE